MLRTDQEVKELAMTYLELVSKAFFIQKMYLFGSYAKQSATQDSDIDIALVSNDFEGIPYESLLKILFKMARNVDPIIEVIPLNKDEFENPDQGSVAVDIKKEGIVLFQR